MKRRVRSEKRYSKVLLAVHVGSRAVPYWKLVAGVEGDFYDFREVQRRLFPSRHKAPVTYVHAACRHCQQLERYPPMAHDIR